MPPLSELLQASAALHHHLCPRQVLGVRMGIVAGEVLDLDLPQKDKRLLAIVETDGCASDGIAAATNCWVGRRTMRIEDFGKVAATFVDTLLGRSVRIAPSQDARQLASWFAPEVHDQWEAQLLGYQRMPAGSLLTVEEVQLKTPLDQLISIPGRRVQCDLCGEEIMNEREVRRGNVVLCRGCAGQAYYSTLDYLARWEQPCVGKVDVLWPGLFAAETGEPLPSI